MTRTPTWTVVAHSLDTLKQVAGGYSQAHRGLVVLPDGNVIFVKLGTEEATRKWAKKEIAVYRFLRSQGYTFVPDLLATKHDETAFALEAITETGGWSWAASWTSERLEATLIAMDALAAIEPVGADRVYLSQTAIDDGDDGWRPLAGSQELREALLGRLRAVGRPELADQTDFQAMADRSHQFALSNDVLVHNDVRSDNCAWNPTTGRVMLVDWNWAQLGDRRIDVSSLLVSVQRAGLELIPDYADRLDKDALHWLAGFWLRAAVTPMWKGGPASLRDSQLHSGLIALDLERRIPT
ncbi:MAG: aminoglycoside phosphotransferase family protein [Propionibacteriales bacterium]|nr:aminoglycoside phosphotransferase family protein [Propionibacteriales bacterium]